MTLPQISECGAQIKELKRAKVELSAEVN